MAETEHIVSVEKSTVESYTLRVKHRGWAVITLDERTGLLQIHSDYGDYAHHWSSPGGPFKPFLVSLDDDYLMGKLGRRDELDGPSTLEKMRKFILERRRKTWIDRDDAREAWDEIDALDTGTSDAFYMSLQQTLKLNAVLNGEIPVTMNFPTSLRLFLERLWSEFIKCLRQELQAPAPTPVDGRDLLILQLGVPRP